MKKTLSKYEPLCASEEEQSKFADGPFKIDDNDFDEETQPVNAPVVEPFELGDESDQEESIIIPEAEIIFDWKDPWLPSICLTMFFVTPVLTLSAWTFYQLIGRTWIATPFLLHWSISLLSSRLQLDGYWKVSSIFCIVDATMFLFVYKAIYKTVVLQMFTDVDNTPVIEWSIERQRLEALRLMGMFIGGMRLLLGTIAVSIRTMVSCRFRIRPSNLFPPFASPWFRKEQLVTSSKGLTVVLLLVSVGLLCWALVSVMIHFTYWPPPHHTSPGCDPLDTTECWLPFPSLHHMQRDLSSETGWIVNLKGDLLPRLKGGVQMDAHYLNRLDGFSTMGPILFYIEGLKEAYEAGAAGLQGHAHIARSVTPQSITLLIDINASSLVPHSAEVDYLDLDRPQIMIFPAYPLKHGNHYAVAVFNATDSYGVLLPPTKGFSDLMTYSGDSERYDRYIDSVIPALEVSAPWFSYENDSARLQLLFDYITASESSQLGPVRTVRDAALAYIESDQWNWSAHHREIKRIDHDCSEPGTLLARTVHGELDVPWFLDCFGPGCRGSLLNQKALQLGKATSIGATKYIAHIPCSLRAEALGAPMGKPLGMVVEFGHGLFGNRAESFDTFLQQLAHDEGYIVTAMDWRGMSLYDLLIIGKTLLSRPRLFQAVTDNLIQGYANKYALQHFSRSPAFLNSSMLYFSQESNALKLVPTVNNDNKNNKPGFAFYGISQGGILGAGYSVLSKGLIDRAVLGVPGTPFALVMSRSHDFLGYDLIMLLNIYDNRQVRMLLALCQMGWDSVEGAGVLATPLHDNIPPMLLQAGLGDAIVPTFAAEALARGLGAKILEHNPRADIFGIERVSVAAAMKATPSVVLTEILYEAEFASLPMDNTIGEPNSVHFCVRRDNVMIRQVADFISQSVLSDPCVNDGCIRENAWC